MEIKIKNQFNPRRETFNLQIKIELALNINTILLRERFGAPRHFETIKFIFK